jgi:hypothetical protein
MNLEDSIAYSNLMQAPKIVEPKKRSKVDVAKRVFQLAANGGFPYKYATPEGWARKWLTSREFTLMEIDIHAAASLNVNAVASPHKPKNSNRVEHYFHCSADALDPIVVDLNKRNVGKSYLGYVPEVIVLDGKHRKMAQLRQGRTKILAWVGCEAAKQLQKYKKVMRVVDAAREDIFMPPVEPTKMASTIELFAATVPATGLANVSPRQTAGEGGARPKDSIHGKKIRDRETNEIKSEIKELLASKERNAVSAKRIRSLAKELKRRYLEGCGARSSGSLVNNDSSDSSAKLEWDSKKPQAFAPGTYPGYVDTFGDNGGGLGSGIGPRIQGNEGATKSEMARILHAHKDCKCGGECTKCKDATLKAGGPGSGRHAGSGNKLKEMAQKGKFKGGWKQGGRNEGEGYRGHFTSFYDHPKHGTLEIKHTGPFRENPVKVQHNGATVSNTNHDATRSFLRTNYGINYGSKGTQGF